MIVCVWVCPHVRGYVSCILLFVSEGHNEKKDVYVCYLNKCIHVRLIVPPSINKDYMYYFYFFNLFFYY